MKQYVIGEFSREQTTTGAGQRDLKGLSSLLDVAALVAKHVR